MFDSLTRTIRDVAHISWVHLNAGSWVRFAAEAFVELLEQQRRYLLQLVIGEDQSTSGEINLSKEKERVQLDTTNP